MDPWSLRALKSGWTEASKRLRPQWTQIRSRIPVTDVISQWCRPILQLMFFFVFMPSECEAHGSLSVRWTTETPEARCAAARSCGRLPFLNLAELDRFSRCQPCRLPRRKTVPSEAVTTYVPPCSPPADRGPLMTMA